MNRATPSKPAHTIALCPVGTRGDIDPMLALAAGLKDAGCEPLFCASTSFAAQVEAFGFSYIPIEQDAQAFNIADAQAEALLPWHPRRAFATVASCFAEAVDTQFQALLSGPVADASMLIGGSGLHFAGPSVAEVYQIPYRLAILSPPVVRSMHIGPPIFDWPSWMSERMLQAAWKLYDRCLGILLRAPLNKWRAELGLAPLDGSIHEHLHGHAVQLAVDPVLCPIPPGYPEDTNHTHAWRLVQPAATLHPMIEDFLAQGPAPVYAGFGSNLHSHHSPVQITALVCEASRITGQRLIFTRPELAAPVRQSDDVLLVGAVDHQALFPRCAMAIHHGGAGVVQTAARAGIPQLGVPNLTDTFYWGRRIEALGIGPASLPLRKLSCDALAVRIHHTLSSPKASEKAAAIATQLQGADGVAEAIPTLLRCLPTL